MVDITNIDIGKIVNNNNSNILDELDKRIEIRFLKEKKTSRTYIIGLEGFIEQKKDLEKITEKMKKKFATSLLEKTLDDGRVAFGLSGDHTKKVKEYLINEIKIPEDKIQGV